MNVESAKRFFLARLSPSEAAALQQRWRARVSSRDRHGRVRRVCGVDVAYDAARNLACAASVVVELPGLEEVERSTARLPVSFPYIPGLLGFREIPAVLAALERLAWRPDLLLVDGHGLAHPRRCGLASMLGLALGMPSIGCAKSVLVGSYQEPRQERGHWTRLAHEARGKKEVIGAALRTRAGVRPVFVSIGHRVSLPFAIRMVMACTDGFRLPRPIRLADRLAAQEKSK